MFGVCNDISTLINLFGLGLLGQGAPDDRSAELAERLNSLGPG